MNAIQPESAQSPAQALTFQRGKMFFQKVLK